MGTMPCRVPYETEHLGSDLGLDFLKYEITETLTRVTKNIHKLNSYKIKLYFLRLFLSFILQKYKWFDLKKEIS